MGTYKHVPMLLPQVSAESFDFVIVLFPCIHYTKLRAVPSTTAPSRPTYQPTLVPTISGIWIPAMSLHTDH